MLAVPREPRTPMLAHAISPVSRHPHLQTPLSLNQQLLSCSAVPDIWSHSAARWARDPNPGACFGGEGGQGGEKWGSREGVQGWGGVSYHSRSTAAWGSGPSEPQWWRRLCPPVPTWHCGGDLRTGREGVSWASLASQPVPITRMLQKAAPH